MTRKCYVCEAPDEVDRHHVLPVEYGGAKDGHTVDLCTRCHRLVHRAAELYYTTGQYTDNYNRIAGTPNGERALVLIRYIIRAKGEHEASGKTMAEDARNMVAISCTPEELMMFHAVKQQMGMKSLPKAIKAVMYQQYQKQAGVKHVENVPESSSTDHRKSKGRKVRDSRKGR